MKLPFRVTRRQWYEIAVVAVFIITVCFLLWIAGTLFLHLAETEALLDAYRAVVL